MPWAAGGGKFLRAGEKRKKTPFHYQSRAAKKRRGQEGVEGSGGDRDSNISVARSGEASGTIEIKEDEELKEKEQEGKIQEARQRGEGGALGDGEPGKRDGESHSDDEDSETDEDKEKRLSLHRLLCVGVNEVTRALEKGELRLLVLNKDTYPAFLVAHLPPLAQLKVVQRTIHKDEYISYLSVCETGGGGVSVYGGVEGYLYMGVFT